MDRKEKISEKYIDSKSKFTSSTRGKTIFISIILIATLGFLVYVNSLNGKFVWDDEALIKENTYIKSWSNIQKIFSGDIGSGSSITYYFYRPLQIFTYMVDYSLWKLNVAGYHFTNILLHILVALSIYWLINILFNDRTLSLFTSLLFVVHPIHTETVSYISGRADFLATLFLLLCFIFYTKGGYYKKSIAASYSLTMSTCILLLLALLSKESSLIFPVLLLFYHFAFKKEFRASKFFSLLGIAFIYIILRVTLFSYLLTHSSCSTTLLQRIPGFFVAITNYIKLIFLPFNLHMEYGNRLFSFFDPKAILGLIILVLSAIYAFRKRSNNILVFFSVSWIFITLLPVSNIYPINAYMAEHWFYLPSIGLFLILANGLNALYKVNKFKIFATISIIVMLAFYSYLTIKQNNYWKEPLIFYERTLQYNSDSPRLYSNLAKEYSNIGKKEKAIELYKKALEIKPNYLEACYNLAKVYNDIGRNEEAIEFYKKAIEINPNYAKAYNNLGIIYSDIGRNEEAIEFYKKAIEINPNYAMAHNNLAVAYYYKKQYDLAIKHCDRAIELGYSVNPAFLKLIESFPFFQRQ